MFAADQLGQVTALLFFRAVAVDLVHAQIGVRPVGQADRGAGAGDFFHGHHVGQVAHIGAAVFFTHGNAKYTQFTELTPEVHGELITGIDLRRARCDFRLGELAHGVAQHVNVGTEVEVEAGKIHVEVSVFAAFNILRLRKRQYRGFFE